MRFFHFVRESFQFTMWHLFHITLVTLLWVVLLVPVITIPGATLALFYFARQAILQGEPHFQDFWEGFKKYFWKGWKIVLPYAVLLFVLIYDVSFFLAQAQPMARLLASIPMAVFSLLLIVQNYALVFFVREDGALWVSVRRAFLLAASNILFSLGLLLLILLYFLGLYVTRIGLLLLFAGPVAVFETKAVQILHESHGIEL